MPVVFKNNLGAIAAAIAGEIDAATGETANDIGDLAQQLAPVDTGALRDSKTVTQSGPLWRVAFTAPYAVYVEYGTDKSAAQPFLTPAVRAISLTFRAKERIKALIGKNKA